MCMFCAAIPAAAAVGAKLSADQVRAMPRRPRPILRLTALAIGLLLLASIAYHTTTYRP